MPHHKSCKKRVKTNEKSRIANREIKSRINTASKKVVNADSKEAAQEALKGAYSVLDKAVKVNVLHKKNAANKKAKLSAKVAAIA